MKHFFKPQAIFYLPKSFFFLFRNSSDNKRTKDNTTIQIIKHIKNNHTKKNKTIPYSGMNIEIFLTFNMGWSD